MTKLTQRDRDIEKLYLYPSRVALRRAVLSFIWRQTILEHMGRTSQAQRYSRVTSTRSNEYHVYTALGAVLTATIAIAALGSRYV